MATINGRASELPVDPMFLQRWSPRAFTGEAIPHQTLLTIFEAARWAPSCYNAQPWRFCYALRDGPRWDEFLGFLIPFNQSWAKNASVLAIAVSNSVIERPNVEPIVSRTHAFDTGAAWMSLALQAMKLGWAAHGMIGFDVERAHTELKAPADHRVEAAIAIGRPTDAAVLGEALAAREHPSGRNPLSAMLIEGGFAAP